MSLPSATVSAATRAVSRRDKVSLLLLALDRAAAVDLMMRLDAGERDILAASADALPSFDETALLAIVEEFERDFSRGARPLGTKADLESLLGDVASAGSPIPNDPIDTVVQEPIWPQLAKLKIELLASHIAKQHPQVIAFTLSNLEPALTANVLKSFTPDVRSDLVCRMLAQKPPSPEACALVEGALRELLAIAKETGQAAHGSVAKVLNQLDKAETSEVIARIAELRPEDAASLKKLLFAFEDLATLDAKALALVVDRVPVERLVLALNGSTQQIQAAVIGAMSPRAQRVAQSELQNAANAVPGDVVAARRIVVDAVLKLSAEGLIAIGDHGSVPQAE